MASSTESRYSADPSELLPQIVEPPVDVGRRNRRVGDLRGRRHRSHRLSVAARAACDLVAARPARRWSMESVSLADDGARFRVPGLQRPRQRCRAPRPSLAVTTNLSAGGDHHRSASGLRATSLGAALTLSGSAADPEDGTVAGGTALTWRIDLHHDAHIHPLMPPTSGYSTAGSFVTAAGTDRSPDGLVWLEVESSPRPTPEGAVDPRFGCTSFPRRRLSGVVAACARAARRVSTSSRSSSRTRALGLPQTAMAWPQTSEQRRLLVLPSGQSRDSHSRSSTAPAANGCAVDLLRRACRISNSTSSSSRPLPGRLRTYSSAVRARRRASATSRPSATGSAPGAVAAARRDLDDVAALDLMGGRFRLTVAWTQSVERSESGVAVARCRSRTRAASSPSSRPSNLEMAVKMVDGSDFNGHFWVYWTALSNLETVSHRRGSVDVARRAASPNPGSTFGAGADILAFPAD